MVGIISCYRIPLENGSYGCRKFSIILTHTAPKLKSIITFEENEDNTLIAKVFQK